MNELFASVHDALLFAFRYSSQQYALSPMAKLVKAGMAPSGKGLTSTDGAGQAGLILSAIERLGRMDPLMKACIVARYSQRFAECPCCKNPEMLLEEYAIAISELQDAAAKAGIVTGLSVRSMREAIVRRFYEKGISINEVADRLKVPRRSAYDQKSKIFNWLNDIDTKAQQHIAAILERDLKA
jgi:hypothetical protein